MNTNNQNNTLENIFSVLPVKLGQRLIKSYSALKTKALEGEYDAIGVRAGRFAEVTIRVLQHILTGTYISLTKKIKNFKQECEKLENIPINAGSEGLRILMPRALCFLYTMRNKRDFGHVGGEVNANEVDALTAIRLADWCICELIRVSNNIPLEDAQVLCDAIAERQLPYIWNIQGKKRILNTSLSYREQTLLMLYSELEVGILTEDLFEWTEHPNKSNYRRDVLARLHKSRLIEWDRDTEIAIISPLGIKEVESKILV